MGDGTTESRRAFVRVVGAAVPAVALSLLLASAPPGGAAAAGGGGVTVSIGDGEGGTRPATGGELIAQAERQGEIRVIVRMRLDAGGADDRKTINRLRKAILASVPNARNVRKYQTIPMLAMTVDAAGVRALLDNPNVAAISEDVAVPVTVE